MHLPTPTPPENNSGSGRSNVETTYPHPSTHPLRALFARFLALFGLRQAFPVVPPTSKTAPEALVTSAREALTLLNECITLIDHLEGLHVETWPTLAGTTAGAMLVNEVRPELHDITAALRADLDDGTLFGNAAETEAEAVSLTRGVYALLDDAEREIARGF